MTYLEAVIRFLHLGAASFLVGGFSFNLLVAWPAFKRVDSEIWSYFLARLGNQFWLARWSLLVAFLSALFGLILKIATMTGLSLGESLSPVAVTGVLTGTRYGTVWIVRMALACLLAALLLLEFIESVKRESMALNITGLILSALFLMTLAFAGHASAAEGFILIVQAAVDALHLLAAGVWLGGLVYLAMLFHWARHTRHPSTLLVVQKATARFSRLGFVSVALLLVTGLFNAWHLVGGIPPLLGTDYGYLLLTKLGILIPLMGLASRNRWRLKPRLSALPGHNDREKIPKLLAQLQQGVIAELSLGAAILLVVGMMSITPPARHVQPEWPFSFRLDWSNLAASADVRFLANTGGALSIIGIVLLGYAVSTRRHRRSIAATGGITFVMGTLIVANAVSIDAYPTTYVRPSVAYHAISVANGMLLYGESCAVCHGVAGYGDGPSAADLRPKPADLTARHAATHTAGDLYWWLSHGIKETAMPGFKESYSEDERWDLINFLRALSNAERARTLAPVSDTAVWLVAPDFAYGTNRGETETLKDHRGNKIVLLVLISPPESRDRLEQLEKMSAQLTSAGVEIILVPSDAERQSKVDSAVSKLPVVVEGNDEIFKTYSLFSHSFEADRNSSESLLPKHTEFLIDKRGYIRARWIAREGAGWHKLETLLREIEILLKEKSQVPAPDDHVH